MPLGSQSNISVTFPFASCFAHIATLSPCISVMRLDMTATAGMPRLSRPIVEAFNNNNAARGDQCVVRTLRRAADGAGKVLSEPGQSVLTLSGKATYCHALQGRPQG